MRFSSFTLGQPLGDGFFDELQVDPSGVIRLRGWRKRPVSSAMAPAVKLDEESVPLLQHYRVPRPDIEHGGTVSKLLRKVLPQHGARPVPKSTRETNSGFQTGFVLEYLVPESLAGREFGCISVVLDNTLHERFNGPFQFINPHYRGLFDSREVYHRDQIYGSGPPNTAVHPDVLALAQQLEGPLLDFGCGSGALIAELQAAGTKAQGIELQTEMIEGSIRPELRSSITLYDGQFPSPLSSGIFRSVFCSEVLEHIPDYQGAIQEIARLTTERAMFTVPDASAIALGFRHALVPWHLLEGTHVNFFTQKSLQAALEAHFSQITFGRICPCAYNDASFYVSIVADCFK
jgi:SAM-dependent methyltransferase